ncbi:MAG: RsmB/NOP family class I SAM-dependent RNA methyltransferase, partial [Rhodomicrobium sp.]|nr:RsmB/NOP family class I SAM-dependent RNA methyltransferase [Rhodomicrobium sp.]
MRAPIDLRVNLLKADRGKVLKALENIAPPRRHSLPPGRRIPAPGPMQKNPNVEAETAHGRGWFEVQDEASQIAAYLSGAGPRLQVLDLCAGSGGKTLAMAALMQNTGQIHAYDADKQRLRPIFERLKRAGARNVQVLDAGDEAALDALSARMDIVFADAPCSGSGVWRRRPDAKWRLTPEALAQRIAEQRAVLERAASLVKPGGRLVYATCSVLPSENGEQTRWFLERMPDFAVRSWSEAWQSSSLGEPPESEEEAALQLTPLRHGTDGFYISILEKRA